MSAVLQLTEERKERIPALLLLPVLPKEPRPEALLSRKEELAAFLENKNFDRALRVFPIYQKKEVFRPQRVSEICSLISLLQEERERSAEAILSKALFQAAVQRPLIDGEPIPCVHAEKVSK